MVKGHIETLADELAGLIVKPTIYGYRFDHETQTDPNLLIPIHDDRACGIGMSVLWSSRLPPSPDWVTPVPIPNKPFVTPSDREFSDNRNIWGGD